MANDLLKKFASELKSIRESQGLTIENLYNKTRIEIKYLQAIEEARFDVIADVYMRSFVKSYIKTLDLDEAAYIKRYDNAKAGIEIKNDEKTEELVSEDPIVIEEPVKKITAPINNVKKRTYYNTDNESYNTNMKRNFNIMIYIFLTIVVGLIIAIVLLVRSSKSEIVVEKSFEAVNKEQEERYNIKEELRDSSFAYMNGKINVKLRASEMSWFKIKVDSNDPFELLLRKGKDSLIVAEKVIELNIGNSFGIELYINNIKVNIPGQKTRVKNIRIDPSGINEIAGKSGYKNDATRY
ncbi:MAG: RodZ domain-containing protein [bacterium]